MFCLLQKCHVTALGAANQLEASVRRRVHVCVQGMHFINHLGLITPDVCHTHTHTHTHVHDKSFNATQTLSSG